MDASSPNPGPLAAVVLCAGKGTRMKSEKAKVLHSLLGRPLCFYPIWRAVELGAAPVVAVLGHQADEVQKVISEAFPDRLIRYAMQPEQRGTGHAVLCAREALRSFEGAVLVLYGDVPLLCRETLERLWEAFRARRPKLAMITSIADQPTGYGRVVTQARDNQPAKVLRVVEEKDASAEERCIDEVNAGIYLADSRFLFEALSQLGGENAQGEVYLTDVVERAAKEGEVVAVRADFEEIAGVNDRSELAARAAVLRMRINTEHMKRGVTIQHPETTFIDDGVEIGPNTVIGPMVSIHAGCEVGADVRIWQGCVLNQSTVGDGSELRPYSVLDETVVGPRCQVGPFARLRPGSVLEEGVHVGNFVETKKTRIRKGAKANHLTYLGDADIGSGVNVGAGTITCNYDGEAKHPTVISDGAFIGSDVTLVAPVTVGEGAYVGAGSTITEDVPPGSLALGRGRQVVKEGWAVKRRARRSRGS
ncbi:MAG: bifunctional UDP-N-acetylglucosamine diphosphorylase/glucosamine-1-phosphate N-acetyltransferase GlmU [Myxococcales bacterium]|nr:bifunctional UDP-N-acetylglucosamine diphosphorylase/glucosamine-1-phosphate N-acetyltransferase GlmU [Myxococcales bacterium]